MICKHNVKRREYRYEFIDDDNVKLTGIGGESFIISYDDWDANYRPTDKLRTQPQF